MSQQVRNSIQYSGFVLFGLAMIVTVSIASYL
jgi:hypothetical protein